MAMVNGVPAEIIFLLELFTEKVEIPAHYLQLMIANVLVLSPPYLFIIALSKIHWFLLIHQVIGVFAQNLDISGLD